MNQLLAISRDLAAVWIMCETFAQLAFAVVRLAMGG